MPSKVTKARASTLAPTALQAPASAEIADRLRVHGLRATRPRAAVLGAVESLSGHPDVATIAARVEETGGSVSPQGVYDCLASLTAAGLLRRIEPAGSPARYETRVGDNHHHLVCRDCGATHDVDCVLGAAPCLQPEGAGGFAIEAAEVTFWGLCPDCQAAASRPVPAAITSEPTHVN